MPNFMMIFVNFVIFSQFNFYYVTLSSGLMLYCMQYTICGIDINIVISLLNSFINFWYKFFFGKKHDEKMNLHNIMDSIGE